MLKFLANLQIYINPNEHFPSQPRSPAPANQAVNPINVTKEQRSAIILMGLNIPATQIGLNRFILRNFFFAWDIAPLSNNPSHRILL